MKHKLLLHFIHAHNNRIADTMLFKYWNDRMTLKGTSDLFLFYLSILFTICSSLGLLATLKHKILFVGFESFTCRRYHAVYTDWSRLMVNMYWLENKCAYISISKIVISRCYPNFFRHILQFVFHFKSQIYLFGD